MPGIPIRPTLATHGPVTVAVGRRRTIYHVEAGTIGRGPRTGMPCIIAYPRRGAIYCTAADEDQTVTAGGTRTSFWPAVRAALGI